MLTIFIANLELADHLADNAIKDRSFKQISEYLKKINNKINYHDSNHPYPNV